jgi:aspartate oxidase
MAGMSLLEGFLIGEKAGEYAAKRANIVQYAPIDSQKLVPTNIPHGHIQNKKLSKLRKLSNTYLFVVREESKLKLCEKQLSFLLEKEKGNTIVSHIVKGIIKTALAVTLASILRKETRGAFYRMEYDKPDPKLQKSIIISENCNEVRADWDFSFN